MNVRPLMIMAAMLITGLVLLVSARNLDISYKPSPAQPVIAGTGEFQKVVLRYINYQYQMQPNVLKKGIPVRMEVDLSTVSGCMTAVQIPAFKVSKRVSPGDNVITFIPDKIGTFSIACSMGMGKQSFTVVEDTGSGLAVAGNPTEDIPASSIASPTSVCGAGCGCGSIGRVF